MKRLADHVMACRAERLLARIARHLPPTGAIADIGSGTGHNGEAIRHRTRLAVQDFDVADLHWVGPGPVIFQGARLPADSQGFDAILLLFVLQYAPSPRELLMEIRRVTRGPVIVVQSTYRGRLGRAVLAIRECLWGRLAFRLAVLTGIISPTLCPLRPRQHFTRSALWELFHSAGFTVAATEQAEWVGLQVSRDLFVLEP